MATATRGNNVVAYSLKARFVVPTLVGLGLIARGDGEITVNGFTISTFVRHNLPAPKRQTIRAKGKRRHARPGETLQLYTAMRTKQCRLIGLARCVSVHNIVIMVRTFSMLLEVDGVKLDGRNAHNLARADGFGSIDGMHAFWRENHPGVKIFRGFLIKWEPIPAEETSNVRKEKRRLPHSAHRRRSLKGGL